MVVPLCKHSAQFTVDQCEIGLQDLTQSDEGTGTVWLGGAVLLYSCCLILLDAVKETSPGSCSESSVYIAPTQSTCLMLVDERITIGDKMTYGQMHYLILDIV